MNIRWTNKYSQESGFVKTVSKVKNCFINTYEKSEARVFRSVKEAQNAINALTEMGEAEDNIFVIEE